MNTVKVPAADFVAGQLPEVCVRSGGLAANRYRVIARSADGHPLNGAVSLHTDIARRIALLRLIGAAALAFSFASAVTSLATGLTLMLVLTALTAALAVGSLIASVKSGVRARVVDGGDSVELSPAHDGFKLAMMLPGGSRCGDNCDCGNAHKEVCDDESASTEAPVL